MNCKKYEVLTLRSFEDFNDQIIRFFNLKIGDLSVLNIIPRAFRIDIEDTHETRYVAGMDRECNVYHVSGEAWGLGLLWWFCSDDDIIIEDYYQELAPILEERFKPYRRS